MKTKVIIASLVGLTSILNAQNEWAGPGSNNTTGTINRTGYVGIGTSSPAYPIDIHTSSVAGMGLRIKQNGQFGEATIRLDAVGAGGRHFSMHSTGNGWTAPGSFQIFDETAGACRFMIQGSTGNLGIGTTTPNQKLAVAGNISLNGTHLVYDSQHGVIDWGGGGSGSLFFRTLNTQGNIGVYTDRMIINQSGQVRIGALHQASGAHTNYQLAVDGKVVCRELIVTAVNWADFVFDPNYKLRPLDEVEKFYKKNRHLPEVPTTAEITEIGNDLGKTDALLLQKIEELTLYLVEQNKKSEQQQERIQKLESELNNLKAGK